MTSKTCPECGSTRIRRVVIARIPAGPVIIGDITPLREIAVHQCRDCKTVF